MFDFVGDIIGELILGTIGIFFRITRWLGIVYAVIAVGAGLFLWSKLFEALGDIGAALSCAGTALVLLILFAVLHVRLVHQTTLGEWLKRN